MLRLVLLTLLLQGLHTQAQTQAAKAGAKPQPPYDPPLAAVQVHQRWGFIDTNGALVQPPWFLEVRDFSEGLAAVKFSTGLWGYIDKRGMVTVPGRYRVAYSYFDGQALVANGQQWYILNKRGDVLKTTLDTIPNVKRNKCPTPGQIENLPDSDKEQKITQTKEKYPGRTIPCLDIYKDPRTNKYTLVSCATSKKVIKATYTELWRLGSGYLGRQDTSFFLLDSTLQVRPVFIHGYDQCSHIEQIVQIPLLYLQKPRTDSLVKIQILYPTLSDGIGLGQELLLLPGLHPAQLHWQHNRSPVPLYRPLTGAEDSGAIVSQGPWGYIDQQGRVVIKPVFHASRGFF